MGASQIRICAAVSGNGTILRAISEAAASGLLPIHLCGIVSDRVCGALRVASEFGVPATCLEFGAFQSQDQFNEQFERSILSCSPDYVLLYYNRIVTARLLAALPGRVINTHPSLLPAFPGLRVTQRILESSVCFSGATMHLAAEGIDDGPVLAQAACPVLAGDTVASLGFRQFAASVPLALGVLSALPEEVSRQSWSFPIPDGTSAIVSVPLAGELTKFATEFVHLVRHARSDG